MVKVTHEMCACAKFQGPGLAVGILPHSKVNIHSWPRLGAQSSLCFPPADSWDLGTHLSREVRGGERVGDVVVWQTQDTNPSLAG